MEVLKNFGFDPIMLGAQVVNFLIIFYLLKRFLYKPVLTMLKKREEDIKKGLEQSEEGRKTLEKALEEEKRILTKAQDESKKIIESAKAQALEVSKEIEESTRQQNARMIAEAKQSLDLEAKEVEKRLSEKISILAAEMMTKTLSGMLSEKEQKQIVQKALKQVKKVN